MLKSLWLMLRALVERWEHTDAILRLFSKIKFCKWVGRRLLYGLVVRIPGFHPGGPGSTPGAGFFSGDACVKPLYRKF